MSKMGISTVQSYRGAQIFEAVGLDREHGRAALHRHAVADRRRRARRARRARRSRATRAASAAAGDRRRCCRSAASTAGAARGELAQVEPGDDRGAAGRRAPRRSRAKFDEFERLCDDEDNALVTLRGLLELDRRRRRSRSTRSSRVSEIVTRFVTGAMSFGSISAEAHETLAIAMNRHRRRSRTPARAARSRTASSPTRTATCGAARSSRSRRAGSASPTHYLVNADDLQIKIAQGAKPGEGGQLPGNKVDERIAKAR